MLYGDFVTLRLFFIYLTISGVKKIARCIENVVRGSLCYYYYYYYYYYSLTTHGVPAGGRLMEVIRSIEVRHKTAKSLAETLLYIETNARKEKHYWSTIAPSPSISDFVFLHHSGAPWVRKFGKLSTR